MKITPELVEEWTRGELVCGDVGKIGELEFSDVVIDSRGTLPARSLFIAIEGVRFDGHFFVEQAFERGAIGAVVRRNFLDAFDRSKIPVGAVIIEVDDTLQALQRIAGGYRGEFAGIVVGITGSNGKTIVKDMLGSILGQKFTVYRSPGSYNSQVGVPLALLGMRAQHEIALIEVGISQVGEMARLAEIVRPTVGVLTNIGLAHAAGLSDLETTAREKLVLFRGLGEEDVFVCPEGTGKTAGRRVSFGVGGDYEVFDVRVNVPGYDFWVRLPDGAEHEFGLHVPGEHNLHNAVAAIAMAAELRCSVDQIRQGLAVFELSEMRLEMHTTQAGVTLINDAYNSDPVSARAALGVLKQFSSGQRTIAILGDMLDLGARAETAHLELGAFVARAGVDLLVCLGDFARLIGDGARAAGMGSGSIQRFDDFDTLHEFLEGELRGGDVVLFKASRNIGLERAAQRLLESVAPTRLLIDLDAINDNYHAVRARIGQQTGVMAVVKSFAYGNDATKVAQTLIQQGVDALAVAYPDEAIPLRRKGVTQPILVTNVLAAEADKIAKYDLTALVYSMPVARALERAAARANKVVPVHIEVDTGMNRVGLLPADVAEFAKELLAMPHLMIEGMMTHFAAADDAAEDEFTRRQIALFEESLKAVRELGIELRVVHAANTSAAWRFPEARYDLVRVGLGLYGLHPGVAVEKSASGTRQALRMVTRVIHLHEVGAGESVGYGRTYRVDVPTRLATIAVGYNDGFPRFMSNGGEVLIGGTRCPIAGNVCMDVAMVDVSALANVVVGDEVVLFGKQGEQAISVEEWAERGRTISYEILCNISPRVRRIFIKI